MTVIYFTMKKIRCETDLVFDKFEIGSGKRKQSPFWSKLELRWWNLVVKHFSSISDMPCEKSNQIKFDKNQMKTGQGTHRLWSWSSKYPAQRASLVTHPFSYSKIERNTCTGSSALLGLNVRLAIEPIVLYSSPQPGPRSRPDKVFSAVIFLQSLDSCKHLYDFEKPKQ